MAFNLAELMSSVDVPRTGTELKTIHIDRLRADEKNFYAVTEDSVAELSANIELVGLQQPLNVRPDPETDGSYIVVSGHRRLAALKLLVSEGKERFADVPCMVVENGSEALNELRLIYGNASTRQLSNWELAKQAERVQELFYRLKEEGIEFPGRMRDHVAEACQISKSKLSRLKVIGEKLEIFLEQWQSGTLSEAVAYELAQCPDELQWRIRDARVKGDKLQADKLRRVRENWEQGARWNMEFICTASGKVCGHGDVALRRDLEASSWQGLCRGDKCCLKCPNGAECGQIYNKCDRMCKVAADKVKARNKRDEADREKARAKEKERQDKEFAEILRPYVKAAEAAGLEDGVELNMSYVAFTVADLKEACENPDKLQQQWTFRNAGGKDLMQMAERLNCSVDYLLGRTEVMAVAEPSQSASQTALPGGEPRWQTGEPERDGKYWCKIDFRDGFEPWLDDMTWSGGSWKALDKDATVIGWWPLPEG